MADIPDNEEEGDSLDYFRKIDDIMAKTMTLYDRQGNVITFSESVRLQETIPDYCRVGEDLIQQGTHEVRVSTVWIGIPQPAGLFELEAEKPLIFETMVFCEGSNFAHRYATEDEAVKGHAEIVACIKEGRPIKLSDQSLDFKMDMMMRLLGNDFFE